VCGLGLFLFVPLNSYLNCVLSGFYRFLPETLRAIVGDGSIPAGWIYTQPITLIGRHRSAGTSSERPARKPFKNPLLMFAYPEIIVLLIFNGTLYAVMYGVTASLSVIFEKVYPYLDQTEIGLCFIPIGLGLFVGSLFSGRAMDSYYKKTRDDLIREIRTDSEKHVDPEAIEKDPSFPLEKARLQILPWVVFIYTTCVIGYGWALQSRVTIAVPLILQFISKFFFTRVVPHDLASHYITSSWLFSYHHIERFPDSYSRHDAEPRIVYYGVCTFALYHYPMNCFEISYSFPLEQYRTLPLGCWYGVHYKTHPQRTRKRMDIRRSWRPLCFSLSLTVRRNPVGTLLATASRKQG
jgi:hypothetical protein